MTTSDYPFPLVRNTLPQGGIEALINKKMDSIINVFSGLYRDPAKYQDLPEPFPFRWAASAASSRAFLESLGKPLGLAEDFESRPGVWWLCTPDQRYEYVIFSDCHRSDAWKGGQICVCRGGVKSLAVLSSAISKIWGTHHAESEHDAFFISEKFFSDIREQRGFVPWPKWEEPAQLLKSIPKPG